MTPRLTALCSGIRCDELQDLLDCGRRQRGDHLSGSIEHVCVLHFFKSECMCLIYEAPENSQTPFEIAEASCYQYMTSTIDSGVCSEKKEIRTGNILKSLIGQSNPINQWIASSSYSTYYSSRSGTGTLPTAVSLRNICMRDHHHLAMFVPSTFSLWSLFFRVTHQSIIYSTLRLSFT